MQINNEYIKKRKLRLYSRFVSYAFFEGRPLTTSGRWFNPVVFAIYKIAKFFPKLKNVTEPIFILGTGRSGTTILGIILSIHKDVGFLNEPKALWHEVYPYEDIIGSYSMEEASYKLDEAIADETQRKNIHKIFGFYLFTTFNSKVVDKYPELVFRIPYVKKLFPDAKFIFLVRNGWDTVASIDNWSQRLGTSTSEETQNWWGRNNRKWDLLVEQILKPDKYFSDIIPFITEINNHRDMAALEWIATMRQGLLVLQLYPESILRVNYEELTNKPKSILESIQTFSNLDYDDVYINYGVEVLKNVKAKDPVELHPKIMPLFLETMEKLGYITH
jgi:hypothetical protein